MSEYRNVADVVAQLRGAGLLLETVKKDHGGVLVGGEIYVESTRSIRCDVSGEKRRQTGAYRLHELRLSDGIWITGAYWLTNGAGACFKIDLNKTCDGCGADYPLKSKACPSCGSRKSHKREVPPEQIEAHKKRMADLRRQAEADAARVADRAASWADAVWLKCREVTDVGEHDYLVRKKLHSAHGARLFDGNDGIVLDGAEKDDYEYLAKFKGSLVVPMCDLHGRRRGLQFILSRTQHKEWLARRDGKDKTYWPEGIQNDGLMFILGGPLHTLGLVAEGFATAATLAEASGIACAVTFDAGGVPKVGEKIWRSKRKRVNLLYCADDDWLQKCMACGKMTAVETDICVHCGQPHKKANAGVTKAREGAQITNGAWVAPQFSAVRPVDRKGPTDFNDLRVAEGEQTVAAQIEAKLLALEWRTQGVNPPSSAGASQNEGRGERLAMLSPDEVAERFSPVWSTDDVYYFDHIERVVCAKASLTGRMGRHGWDMVTATPAWARKPEVSLDQVDFDPTCDDKAVVYNLWGGWRRMEKPAGATCDAILELLEHLCSFETGISRELYDWVLKWLAYPLQHVGAKMQSCILMHGGQGAGKNTVFNNLLDIYGFDYSVEFGPKQLEKRFNALFSKKMFAIGNEIVASRDDLYHVKGQIKHMITERRWVVEAKNKDERWERNCCNFIFLSNELRPAALDRGDRRHCVIWTPHVPDPGDPERDSYLKRVMAANAERKNGGAAALYDYLMSLDLGDFDEATWPPMTEAKRALIEDNLDSRERFWELLRNEEVGGLPCVPCLSEDFYSGYRAWANATGIGKSVAQHSLMSFMRKQRGVVVNQEYYFDSVTVRKERRMIVFPYQAGEPTGKSKPHWLGECVDEFRNALSHYKEAAR